MTHCGTILLQKGFLRRFVLGASGTIIIQSSHTRDTRLFLFHNNNDSMFLKRPRDRTLYSNLKNTIINVFRTKQHVDLMFHSITPILDEKEHFLPPKKPIFWKEALRVCRTYINIEHFVSIRSLNIVVSDFLFLVHL